MKTRLFIHIGTHKTGSTAIQRALWSNQNALLQKGVVFLSLPREIKTLEICEELNLDIVHSFRKYLDRRVAKKRDKGSKAIRYVMSWEGFSGNALDGYLNAAIAAQHIKRATEGMDVRIVVYLRKQDEFIESMYAQRIKAGESYTFQSFLDSLPAFSFNWEQLLTSYSELFGKENMIVRRYDKAVLLEPNSLLLDFFQAIGIDMQDITFHEGFVNLNPGYTRDALEIARLSNPYLNSNEKVDLRQILQQTSFKQPFESYSYFSDKNRNVLLLQYADSNAIVAREYFNESSGVLFPFASTDSNIYQGFSIESITPILVKAILSSQARNESFTGRVLKKAERKVVALLRKAPWLYSKARDLSRKVGI